MKWELPLLVGFILLFSIWTTFPSDNNYFYTDANGFRHYVLTPAISTYDNAIDSLTNVQFTRYDNPWLAPTEITILVAGIFVVLLVKESIQLAFRNRIFTILSLQNYFSSNKLSKTNELLDLETENNKDLYNYSNLIHLKFKKFNIKKLIFIPVIICFLVVLLFNSFYFDSNLVFGQSDNKKIKDEKNVPGQEKEKQNNDKSEKREPKPKREDLGNRDEIKQKFKNYSQKIDKKLLKVLTDDDPRLVAKRMGTSYQDDKTPVYIYLKNKNLVSSLSPNIKITGSDENIVVARLSLNEINELAKSESVISLSMPHLAKFHDILNFTEQTSIFDSSITDPRSIQTQNFLQTIKEFSEASIVLDSHTTGSPPFHDIPVFTEAVVILLGSTTINPITVSEGIAFSNADNFHNAGITGNGVTVAIIDANFFVNDPRIASNIVHSQLIDSGNLCGGSITCGVSSGNSHGTAVAQIVVGMAPDVILRVYVIGNSVDFNNAVQDAIDNGAQIITVSLGFPTLGGDGTTGFFRDGTSTVAKKVDLAQNAGILVTVSVGNEGLSHWMGNYAISPVVPSTIGIGELEFYESVMNFQPTASGLLRACLPVTDFGDNNILTWNDWVTSTQDYDFYLYDSTMQNQIGGSTVFQFPFGAIPLEEIPSGAAVGSACLVVASFSSSEDHFLHINAEDNLVDPSFVVRSGSLGTPADAIGALTIGAIDVFTDDLESFSSSGPTDNPRPKPEICGPDNTFSPQSGLNPFLGTSASAPHVAGGAALLLEQNPGLTEPQLRNLLINDARFNSNYSIDNLCGSGALNLQTPAVSLSDAPTFDDVVIILSNISIVDVPKFFDKVFLSHLPFSPEDLPFFKDVVIMLTSISPVDVPTVADDTATNSNIVPADVPSFSDILAILTGFSLVDVPTVTDDAATNSNIFPADVPTVADDTTTNSNIFPADVPSFSDILAMLTGFSLVDVPTVTDDAATNSNIFPADIPSFNEVNIMLTSRSITDVPTVADDAATNSNIFPADVPSFNDVNIMLTSRSIADVPSFSDILAMLTSISPVDVPTVADDAATNSNIFPADVPSFIDVNIMLTSRSIADVPSFSDILAILTSISLVDVPTVADDAATNSNIFPADLPSFKDVTILLSSISAVDTPSVSDKAILTHVPISVTDAPIMFDISNSLTMLTSSDIPSFNDVVIMHSSLSIIDVPTIIDEDTSTADVPVDDVPTFNDAAILLSSISSVDAPSVSDKAILTHLPIFVNDSPKVSDAVTTTSNISPVDILTFNDATILLSSISSIDVPEVSDSITMNSDISMIDSPEVSDAVTTTSDISPVDVPTFNDATILLSGISAVDAPEVSDGATMNRDISMTDSPKFSDDVAGLGERFAIDTPTVADDTTTNSNISPSDLPSFKDVTVLLSSISAVDTPSVSDKAILTPPPISVIDSPEVSDGVTTNSGISETDSPQFSDGVTMNSGISETDSPQFSDSVATNRGISETDSPPQFSDGVTTNSGISETDSPQFSDGVTMNSGISEIDSPQFSEAVGGLGEISVIDTPTIFDDITISSDISPLDSPQFSDSVTTNSGISETDSPQFSEEVGGLGEIFVIDTPTVADDVTTSSDIFPLDVPTFDDVTILLSGISAVDVPRVSDGAFKNLEDDEQGITNNQEEVTATPEQPVLVITTSNAALSMVNVPEEVTNAVLNYEEILTTDVNENKVASIDNPLTIMAETSIGMVEIELPASLTITGPNDWNGEVNLPQVKPPSSVTPPEGETVDSVIELGLGDIEITFDKPVRIVLPGKAGKTAFFERNGITTIIDNVCPEDNFASVNTFLNDGGIEECKIDNGNDLIIWTLHFTSFGTSSSPTSSSSGSSQTGTSSSSFSRGGGGGGGSRGGSSGSGYGGIISNSVRLYEVSWDKCNENIMTIIAGPQEEDLIVKVRTATGLADVILAEEQPYAEKIIFEVILDPDEAFVHVQVELITERIPSIEQKFLDLDQCEGKYIGFTEPKDLIPSALIPIQESPLANVRTEIIPNGAMFETGYGDVDFEINYKIAEGSITDMMIDEEDKSVTFSLDNIKEKELLISLPHELISAVDNNFVILGTKSPQLDYDVIETTDEYVKLKIMLPEGEEHITIIGSNVVPEFGVVAIAVLLISILSIIAVTRSQKFSLIKI